MADITPYGPQKSADLFWSSGEGNFAAPMDTQAAQASNDSYREYWRKYDEHQRKELYNQSFAVKSEGQPRNVMGPRETIRDTILDMVEEGRIFIKDGKLMVCRHPEAK